MIGSSPWFYELKDSRLVLGWDDGYTDCEESVWRRVVRWKNVKQKRPRKKGIATWCSRKISKTKHILMCVCAYPQHSPWALRSQVCCVFKQFSAPLFPASKIFPQPLVKAKGFSLRASLHSFSSWFVFIFSQWKVSLFLTSLPPLDKKGSICDV